MEAPTKTVIVLLGATASGKSALALALAQQLRLPILSTDSRQCYKELSIGTAKPNAEELDLVPHYFINSHHIHENVTAGLFEEYALKTLEYLFLKHDAVLAVGGTGLYIKALCEGLDYFPEIPAEVRQLVKSVYEAEGLPALQQFLAEADPVYYQSVDHHNPQRLMRAMEVCISTGRPFSNFRQGEKRKRPFRILKIGLAVERAELYHRIGQRTQAMLAAGLAEEARELIPYQYLNALQTVGYSEWFAYFRGEILLHEVAPLIAQHTRNYAKRQLTWFRADDEVKWLAPEQAYAKVLSLFSE